MRNRKLWLSLSPFNLSFPVQCSVTHSPMLLTCCWGPEACILLSWVRTLTLCVQFAVGHTSQIFYTMWYQLRTVLTQCSSLPASLKIGIRNICQITDHIMVTGGDIAATAYSWNWRLRQFLRCKLGKTPHKPAVLDRISERQFPTEMPVIRSHVESGVAMESICF